MSKCVAPHRCRTQILKLRELRKCLFCIAVILEIQNVFDTLPWPKILVLLINTEVPEYLARIVRSYLNDRLIEFKAFAVVFNRQLYVGFAYPVLGPTFCNITFNRILQLHLLVKIKLICYSYCTLVMCNSESTTEVEQRINLVLAALTLWIKSPGCV